MKDFEDLIGPIEYSTVFRARCPACGDPSSLVVTAGKASAWAGCQECGAAGRDSDWLAMASGKDPGPSAHDVLSLFMDGAYARFRDEFHSMECATLRMRVAYHDVLDTMGPPFMGLSTAGEVLKALAEAFPDVGEIIGTKTIEAAKSRTPVLVAPAGSAMLRVDGLWVVGPKVQNVACRKASAAGGLCLRHGVSVNPRILYATCDPRVMTHAQTSHLMTGGPSGQLDMLAPLLLPDRRGSPPPLKCQGSPGRVVFMTDGWGEEAARRSLSSLCECRTLASPVKMRSLPSGSLMEFVRRSRTLSPMEASARLAIKNDAPSKNRMFVSGDNVLRASPKGPAVVARGLAVFKPGPRGVEVEAGGLKGRLDHHELRGVSALNKGLARLGLDIKVVDTPPGGDILSMLTSITKAVERSVEYESSTQCQTDIEEEAGNGRGDGPGAEP